MSRFVSEIGSQVFMNCDSLEDIVLPQVLTKIGEYSFAGCSKLSNVIFYSTYLPKYLFYNCNSLTKITLNCHINRMEEGCFENCYSLREINMSKITGEIAPRAFCNCLSLMKLEFSDELKIIGNYSFYSCTNLEELILSKSVEKILPFAFYNCPYLSLISFNENLTEIGQFSFYGCKNLSNLELPEKISSIGKYAFYGCKALSNLTIKCDIDFNYKFDISNHIKFVSFNNENLTKLVSLKLFKYMKNLTIFNVSKEIVIDNNLFDLNTELNVHVYSSIKKIESSAFKDVEIHDFVYCGENGNFSESDDFLKNAKSVNNVIVSKKYKLNKFGGMKVTKDNSYCGNNSKSISTALLVSLIIISIAVILVIVLILFLLYRRKRFHHNPAISVSMEKNSQTYSQI